MTVEKIAISLPSATAKRVRKAVARGDAPSVSAYLTKLVDDKAQEHEFDAVLKQMLDETGGPITDAERREIDRVLDMKPKQTRRRRAK